MNAASWKSCYMPVSHQLIGLVSLGPFSIIVHNRLVEYSLGAGNFMILRANYMIYICIIYTHNYLFFMINVILVLLTKSPIRSDLILIRFDHFVLQPRLVSKTS